MLWQVQRFASFLLLTLSTNQFRSTFSFPSNIGWISATVSVADEEGVLPTYAKYWPLQVWNMRPVSKLLYYFLSKQIYLI